MSHLSLPLALLSLSLVAGSAGAQATPAGTPNAPRSAAEIVASLTEQLRNLVSAQESFYADNNTYSNSLRALGYRAAEGATVMVFRADNRGWAGRAVHPALAGRSCVIAIGAAAKAAPPTTDHEGKTGSREGAPVCDAP